MAHSIVHTGWIHGAKHLLFTFLYAIIVVNKENHNDLELFTIYTR